MTKPRKSSNLDVTRFIHVIMPSKKSKTNKTKSPLDEKVSSKQAFYFIFVTCFFIAGIIIGLYSMWKNDIRAVFIILFMIAALVMYVLLSTLFFAGGTDE